MKYMGSKNRISKDIIPLILEKRTSLDQWYVEPFCGGCNIIDKIEGNRIASDINPYLMAMWKSVAEGWIPRNDYTEEEYNYIKNNKDENPCLTGYFGFSLSYGDKFFGGWCRDSIGKRNYVLESYKNSIKQFPNLRNVIFKCSNYYELEIPNNSIIYCDPPYKDTTKYNNKFNYEDFYNWCRKMKIKGHEIYISEYYMPDDFVCIYEKEISSSLTKNTGSKKGIEKLFTL